MSRVVILHATVLTKLPVVGVLDRRGAVELLNPHSHAHILHLEQLQKTTTKVFIVFRHETLNLNGTNFKVAF